MGAPDISIWSLVAAFGLLAIPILVSLWLRLGIVAESVISLLRMAAQLTAAGFLLSKLFEYDRAWLNLIWLAVMMLVASLTTVQKSQLRLNRILVPVCVATFSATLAITLYFNAFVVRIENLFAARYAVVIGGMILGNVLAGNIISLTHFFASLKDREERFLYFLGNGATLKDALLPFFRDALIRALRPALARMATMGIVALPGMMTGQMLGGSNPMTAIKYQIAIMLAIFSTQVLGMTLSIIFSCRIAFNEYGVLRREIFVKR
ncbi:MAG: putative ABC transport system permease protein [Verrucomicrobiales bacterium]|jgi:putative ABC transport system permease protein